MAEFKLNGREKGTPALASPLVFAAYGVIIRPEDTCVLDRLYEFAGIPRDKNLDEDEWIESFEPNYRFLRMLRAGVFKDGFDQSGNCHVLYIKHTFQGMNPTHSWANPDTVAGATMFPLVDASSNAYKQLLQFCNDYGIEATPGIVLANFIH